VDTPFDRRFVYNELNYIFRKLKSGIRWWEASRPHELIMKCVCWLNFRKSSIFIRMTNKVI
jgi:hypothetical protein